MNLYRAEIELLDPPFGILTLMVHASDPASARVAIISVAGSAFNMGSLTRLHKPVAWVVPDAD